MNSSEKTVFKMFEQAARISARAPTNSAIIERVGWGSLSEASRAIQALELAGAISVVRYNSGRMVTLLTGPMAGQSTAALPESLCKKPWRERGTRPRLKTVAQRVEVQAVADEPRGAFALARPVLAHAPASAMKGRELLIGGEIWGLIESESESTGRPLGVVFDEMMRAGANQHDAVRRARPSLERLR